MTVANPTTYFHKLTSSKPVNLQLPADGAHLQQYVTAMDQCDPLRKTRAQFSLPPNTTYLCGNSLGPLPLRVPVALNAHLAKWQHRAVAGHFEHPEPWASIEDDASKLSMPLVGARFPHEVVVMNSLTVNLHLFLTAFYRPKGTCTKVIVEHHCFSSDDYALRTHLQSRNIDQDTNIIRLKPRNGEDILRTEDILKAIRDLAEDGHLALVLLPGVQFYTGQVMPLQQIANECQRLNVPFGADLAHSVANVPLCLHDWGVDFAVWCNYKYVNGGPGAIAGAFLHHKHARAPLKRLAGWWGHDAETRFTMPSEFVPQLGARGFQLSNPSVMSIVPVTEALRVIEDAGGVAKMREKSLKLTMFLDQLVRLRLGKQVQVVTPQESASRGCQLSLRLLRGKDGTQRSVTAVNEGLEKVGVMCDVREPDVLRVSPAPLYNSFHDVYTFVRALERELGDVTTL